MKLENKKDEFLAKIIHDLKTPTCAQIKALESFLETGSKKINQEENDLIKLTLNSCNYMHRLIDIFFLVHKLNYEKIKLNYEKFDFIKLINEIIFELNILLKYHSLEIEFQNNDEIEIIADRLQIKRVVENIISNSINHAYKNSKILLISDLAKNCLIFKVQNASPYIEPKVLDEIFEKFKTCQSSYNKAGVGLGLYLSKEIIKAHKGEMIAKSSLDNINTFGFIIPVK